MYFVELSEKAKKFLNKSKDSKRIISKLEILKETPVPSDAKFICRHRGDRVFRIRIGAYRALYKIKEKIVLVVKIDKRPRVYSNKQ